MSEQESHDEREWTHPVEYVDPVDGGEGIAVVPKSRLTTEHQARVAAEALAAQRLVHNGELEAAAAMMQREREQAEARETVLREALRQIAQRSRR
jgi:hypothetical protein